MKTSELRIGNWVHFDNLLGESYDYQFTLRHFIQLRIHTDNPDDLNIEINNYHNPIPLTEEWLLKFGFTHHKSEPCEYYAKSWGHNGVEIITKDYHYKGFEYELSSSNTKFIEYVHQLQNLYFALTGEELTNNT